MSRGRCSLCFLKRNLFTSYLIFSPLGIFRAVSMKFEYPDSIWSILLPRVDRQILVEDSSTWSYGFSRSPDLETSPSKVTADIWESSMFAFAQRNFLIDWQNPFRPSSRYIQMFLLFFIREGLLKRSQTSTAVKNRRTCRIPPLGLLLT